MGGVRSTAAEVLLAALVTGVPDTALVTEVPDTALVAEVPGTALVAEVPGTGTLAPPFVAPSCTSCPPSCACASSLLPQLMPNQPSSCHRPNQPLTNSKSAVVSSVMQPVAAQNPLFSLSSSSAE